MSKPRTARGRLVALVVGLAIVVSACTPGDGGGRARAKRAGTDRGSDQTLDVFDSSTVHTLRLSYAPRDYEALIATFRQSGEKEWIEATVTIDGVEYRRVGIRLKGNSSLMGLRRAAGGAPAGGPGGSVSADEPEGLPWLIRLDEFIDGQDHQGIHDFVVRSNNSETALNDAVALELLDRAGLASQRAMAVRLTVNSRAPVLRLVIEHPDDVWDASRFDTPGALYKAESTGDYRYRGKDPKAYDEVFDQEAGAKVADLTPLIEFLDFINNADDEAFAANLAKHLDVDAFTIYLAMMELVNNFDDIDGPGNNSYLRYDQESGSFTVVPWDMNLAFGGLGGAGGPAAFGGVPPDGRQPPALPGGALPGGPRPGSGFPGRSNILVQRFLANTGFKARYDRRLSDLRAVLYTSGVAAQILDRWVTVLLRDASDLVSESTITNEAAAIATHFDVT